MERHDYQAVIEEIHKLEPGERLQLPVSDEAKPWVDKARRFIDEVAKPFEDEYRHLFRDEQFHLDDRSFIKEEILEARKQVRMLAAKEGLYAAHLPESMGGTGLPLATVMYLHEEAYRNGFTLAKEMVSWTEGPTPMLQYLHPEVAAEVLPQVVSGEKTLCFCMTEWEAGSDINSMRTHARRDGGDWIINGTKAFISWAAFADYAQVFAVTGERNGRPEITGFLVDVNTPGFEVGASLRNLIEDGSTFEVHLNNVRVPDRNRIGEVGDGLKIGMMWINYARIRRGGQAPGLGRFLFDHSLNYARKRRTFGKRIGDHQAVAFMLADLYITLLETRALSEFCLKQIDRDPPWTLNVSPETMRYISTIKVHHDEALFKMADLAVQIHGAHGLLKAAGIEKVFRVARNMRIPAGTSEIQRSTIARTFGFKA